MTFDLQKIIESKRRFRERLAARPVAEKLAILEQLRDAALAIHASRLISEKTGLDHEGAKPRRDLE